MQLKDLKEKASGLDVLYVEDDLYLQRQNLEILEQLFHSIVVANDGESAINIYKEKSFDLVITDINIPKINGFTMIKMMLKRNSIQKFLVTTVYKKEDLQHQLDELDIKYFLQKPVKTKVLFEKIESIVDEVVTT